MRAMILAAGMGTRLRPLTETIPKPLIEVAGRPMIAFALDLVRAAGIREVVINLHHLGDQIRARLGDGSAYGVRISYTVEDPILETGGGIANARPLLDGDAFAVLNADTFIDIDLGDVIATHTRRRALATMVLRADPNAVRYGAIEIDADDRIRRFLGHADPGLTTPDAAGLRAFMYPGVMVFDPRIFAYLPAGVYSITRDVFPRLLDAREPLFGYVHTGYWRVLDNPADLAAGRREIATRLGHHPATQS